MRLSEPEYDLIDAVVDGRYRILRLIGRGGMGVVYEAEAVRLRRRCACKVLPPEYTRDEIAIARFEREAQAAARVDHPNVVTIHDTGTTPDGSGYIAMDLLRGESLDCTLSREGPLPWSRARHIALQICRALAAAHAQGVVHRDLKPENCFRITHDGDQDFIKLVDFGIARLSDPDSRDAKRLTATNAILGTCSYMAHELVAGEHSLCDHRVDVWAVGVVLYEMLTGTLPFRGHNQGQIFHAILTETPMPMSRAAPDADIPEALEPIVAKALEKRLDRRFRSIEDLARELVRVDDRGEATPGTLVAPVAEPAPVLTRTGSVDGMAPTLVRAPRTSATPTRSQLHETSSRLVVSGPRQLARWLAAAALGVGSALVALAMLSSTSTPVQPSVGSMQPSIPSPPPTLHVDAVGGEPPPGGPQPAEDIAPPGPSTPRAAGPGAPRPPRRVSREHYADTVQRRLARLSKSAGVRRCLAAHNSAKLRATVEISATTGRVLRLTAQLLMRGSALETCVERESRRWRFPLAAGARNYEGTLHLNAG